MSSPWNKSKLIETALDEQDRRDVADIQALLHFCTVQFKGPRSAMPALSTVLCTILAELYMRGEINDRGLKDQAATLRNSAKQIAKVLRKQSK
jgi:hypothetical protein